MAQKRDKEETEQLKVPDNLPLCIPPPPMPVPASRSDPKGACGHARANSAGSEEAGPVRPEERLGAPKRPREATRCAGPGCSKRIGLVGFRCRCGDVFCAEHRYSDRHDCGYDYKAAGRAAIARENPVVRAAKLVKV